MVLVGAPDATVQDVRVLSMEIEEDEQDHLTIPEESTLALKLAPEALAAKLRLAAAVKLYELGRLSSGAAATLAGIPRPLFLTKLADYGVSTFRMTKEELQGDLARA